jgi:ribosomal protein S18 acetylase RimI-like enzyme
MAHAYSVASARPDEMEEALRLVFNHLPDDDRSKRVANALLLISQGELDPRGITVLRARQRDQTLRRLGACDPRGELLGAMAAILLPGATGLVWPPKAVTSRSQRAIEDQLIAHARSWLEGQGARMAQAITPPAETPLIAPLLRNGFTHMTTLWYLRLALEQDEGMRAAPQSLTELDRNVAFLKYSPELHGLFQETMERTYQGTLDCPELNGVRNLGEIMQGHREQAHSDPGLWWLMTLHQRAAGVLMLTPVPEWDALDISYLGVVPECRGRGLGRTLTAQAIGEARKARATQVTLAVDSRNAPAWKTYVALGFEAQEPRDVYLAVWNQAEAAGPPEIPLTCFPPR